MILISVCSVYCKDTKMTLCNRKVFIITIVFIVVTGLTNNPETESFKNYENIFDFAAGLKNESDTILDYVTKIQALFCPEQPICSAEGDRNSTGGLKTLPEMIGIGTEVSRIEDVHKLVGACCLPCSCDIRSCKEDGNCCMSKIFLDALETNPDLDDQNVLSVYGTLDDVSKFEDENETALYSECIKASWLSYRDKDVFEIANDLTIPSYFMITRCFENNANPEDMTKCQSPSDFDDESMLPVSSLATGRIYWNSHCARCNNDDRNISLWTALVNFDIDIAYFVNGTHMHANGGSLYPETYEGILEFISKIGNILYIPPFPQDENMCLRKNTLMTCNGFKFDSKPTSSWLQSACERIYSPLVIDGRFGGRYPFLNIFCYLCRRQYFKPNTSGQCGYAERHAKGVFEGMAALLDYRASDSSDNAMTIAPRQGKCRCDEIYDPHIHICRRVYCPAGDFMVECHCIQPFKMVFGMPVLLTIKLVPRAGFLETITTRQITKYQNTLKKTLHTISENISVELIGLLECKADAEEYFLSLAVVRSLSGHDTKETIKPFLNYLDNKRRKIEMVVKQTTYSVRLTSRFRLWIWSNRTFASYNQRDLDSTIQSHTVLFANHDEMNMAYYQKFQVLSPLLYCTQIQLNNTEIEEKGDRLTTLRTSVKITISYYRRRSPSTVQVCADEYLKKSDINTGTKAIYSKFYLYSLLIYRCIAILVF